MTKFKTQKIRLRNAELNYILKRYFEIQENTETITSKKGRFITLKTQE